MNIFYLIKYGEISLKGENKSIFLEQLKRNIKMQLKEVPAQVRIKPGRFYLSAPAEYREIIEQKLVNTFGITGFSRALKTEKNMGSIEQAAVTITKNILKKKAGILFKIEVRRTDKSFPLDSYGIVCRLGDHLRKKFKELKVNCSSPDWVLNVEIRDEAYLYGNEQKGPGGLPVSCAGKGLVLLSGGIDSPVAGYLMAKRGLHIDAVYFHTHPFTSFEVKNKVEILRDTLKKHVPYMNLIIVNFTPAQTLIKQKAKQQEVTLLSRAAMMRISSLIAEKRNAICLITGESLSQVASQTAQSIRFSGSYTSLPVFRPLIGLDKNEIIRIAQQIGTYETSILPYPDCCTLFAPKYPVIKPDFDKMRKSFDALKIESLLNSAVKDIEIL